MSEVDGALTCSEPVVISSTDVLTTCEACEDLGVKGGAQYCVKCAAWMHWDCGVQVNNKGAFKCSICKTVAKKDRIKRGTKLKTPKTPKKL